MQADQPRKSRNSAHASSARWEPPTVTQIPIGKETRSSAPNGAENVAEPLAPAAPSSKLGFSFEMAFPLSARVGE